ncbi:MAG: N-acetyl sugar amidotransferase [Agriterribacter sp.]
MLAYDEEKLKKDDLANVGRQYRQCAISVMDTIADPDITFDENGICNYYHEYITAEREQGFKGEEGLNKLSGIVSTIKNVGKNNKYDCVLGLSGGADSSYLAYLAKQLGLKPLIVHFDYGWNSELAVQNIENTVKLLGFDLYTYVMDWEEFKELQRSYFKASVVDLDVPADHMIFGALFKIANKFNLKFLLSGNNVWTEHTLPRTWNYNKFDLVNLKNIHKTYSKTSLKKLPALGLWHYAYYQLVKNIQSVQLLNYVSYNKAEIKNMITKELGWRDYGGKHHESIFTRFYQGYILPAKFNIDKRKAHLSNLIFAGQITKNEALKELSQPSYDIQLQREDKIYVAKKLGFTESEFDEVLSLPNRNHEEFGTDAKQRELYFKIMKLIKPATSIIKQVRR